MLAHGWPGSVWEFNELIPRLTDPARFGGDPADAFTVVAPSLPGYTLSYAPGQPRFDVAAMADVFAELMTDVLGYRRFAAQGGDWGGYVVGGLGARHADKVRGIHLNFLPVRSDIPFPEELSEKERIYQARAPALAEGGDRLPRHPGHEAPDAGLCAHRLPGRPGGAG